MARAPLRKKDAGREDLFCHLCAVLCNPREAAVRAGYPPEEADREAGKLLEREEILDSIGKWRERLTGKDLEAMALAGLIRLAFGSAADAAKLILWDEEAAPNPEGLDLFLVSDLKRPKGGGIEVKLFDRLAALELLLAHAQRRTERAPGDFISALRETARTLSPQGEDHEG